MEESVGTVDEPLWVSGSRCLQFLYGGVTTGTPSFHDNIQRDINKQKSVMGIHESYLAAAAVVTQIPILTVYRLQALA